MRSIWLCCLLLALAHDIASTARPKRDILFLKNLLTSKLFGTETIVIQIPKIPKNETYQLFKIKGYDNIFLKVTRKPKKEKESLKIKFEDPVMVTPEMAIIANYLGTTTQQETVIALNIAKNLLNSGLLGEHETIVKEVLVPMVSENHYKDYIVREPVNSVELITEEKNPMYINRPVIRPAETINVVNRRPVYPAQYPPMVVASEVKYRPLQTRYSYKQETEDADMTYESYNNRGVLVTRTDKVPVKPRYITVRLAEVVSIAANPYLISSQPPTTSTVMSDEQSKVPLGVVPIHSYVMETPSHSTPSSKVVEKSEYVDSNNFHDNLGSFDTHPPQISESLDVPKFMQQSKLPFDIRDHLKDEEIDKLNKYINTKLYLSDMSDDEFTSSSSNDEDRDMNKGQKEFTSGGLINNGKIVSRYSYKQLGDEGIDSTVVRIEDPKLNQTEINLSQNFVYVPPIVNVPPPTANTNNNIDDQGNHNNNDKHESKTSVPITLRGDLEQSEMITGIPEKLKTNNQDSLKETPIVGTEVGQKQNTVKTYKGGYKTNRRPYTAGQGANRTRASSTTPFTGGAGVRNR